MNVEWEGSLLLEIYWIFQKFVKRHDINFHACEQPPQYHVCTTLKLLKMGMSTLYDHLMSTRIFTLMVNKIHIRAPKVHEESGYGLDLDSQTISYYLE